MCAWCGTRWTSFSAFTTFFRRIWASRRVGLARHCPPRYRGMPFNSKNEGSSAVDDEASNICQALTSGAISHEEFADAIFAGASHSGQVWSHFLVWTHVQRSPRHRVPFH